jgi:uncharacterized spore protein YtfJ
MLLTSREGTVVEVKTSGAGCSELVVAVDGRLAEAINYDSLTGPVSPGDKVLLNVTAVEMGLGTGGYHFVMANLSRPEVRAQGLGHIMKLRYTPLQFKVLAVEEEVSLYREDLEKNEGLEGMPVIIAPLHSLVAPAVAGIKTKSPEARVVYVMTDGGALPIAFSRQVRELKAKGLLHRTVTVGHAFGGDLEAVNMFSGLLAARAAEADVAVVAMGPGNVGTKTTWGFSGLEQGEIVNAVAILGGRAVAVPRLSFADPRPRHFGLSHHTRTALGRVALLPALVPIPELPLPWKALVWRQLRESGITERHRLVEVDGRSALDLLDDLGMELRSMGRAREEDEAFFAAGGAAGILASRLLR